MVARHFALIMMAVSVSATVASEETELEELKTEIWAGFKELVLEAQGKIDTMDADADFKEYFKPASEKHSGIAKKIQDFKEKHPGADVSPQALIALSTEQTAELKSASGFSFLCVMAGGPIMMIASLYCGAVFGWNFDLFNVFACTTSFLIPFTAVCAPR